MLSSGTGKNPMHAPSAEMAHRPSLKHNMTMTTDVFSTPGDPLFNQYWILFLLGIFLTPLPCFIGMAGLGSKKENERAAAKACAIGAFFWSILWIVVIVKLTE
eukprot:g1845.t1